MTPNRRKGAFYRFLPRPGFQVAQVRLRRNFDWFAQCCFDAASADGQFLTFDEFKQVYYMVRSRHPEAAAVAV